MTHWMIVTSPENIARTAELGWRVQGIKSRHRRKAERMAPGDTVTYYVTREQAFGGEAEITSVSFEDHDVIWQSKPGEDYPWRFEIRPVLALDSERRVSAESLLDALEFPRKWPREHWHLAFQGNVHVLDDADHATILRAMQVAARGARRAKSAAG